MVGRHDTTTSPCLISHAPELHFPRLLPAILLSQFAHGISPSDVRYCTQSDISFTVPLPMLPQMTGSHPSCSHRSMNSCVPKLLSSVTPPQFVVDHPGPISTGTDAGHLRQHRKSRRCPTGHSISLSDSDNPMTELRKRAGGKTLEGEVLVRGE